MKTSFHVCLDLLLLLAILAIAPANHAATITWTNLNGGSWNSATNWSPNQVPGAADAAVITANGSYTVTLDIGGTLAGLTLGGATGNQTLRQIGGVLVLAGTSVVNANGIFEFVTGSLGGGPLTVGGRLTWTGGALDGALTVASNGALNVGGGGAVSLNGTITNAGSITLTDSATVYLVGSLNNLAGGTVEQRNDQTWINGGGSPLIQNAGTFRKLASSGTTTFAGGLAFVNTGLVDVQTGTLNFPAGFVSSGSFKVPAGAAVTLTGGTFEFKAGHSFTGAGFYGIPGGSVKIVGDLADANFVWTGGTLTSTNRITSVLNWTGGALDGALTVAPNGALNVGGGGAVSLNGTITNAGSITLTDSATVYLVGSLNNLAGGTVEQRNDQTWINGGGSPLIQNAGTFRKLASSGTTTFAGGLAFVNTGLVDVQTGTLNFPAGFVSSGSFKVPAGAAVTLTGGTFEFKAGHSFTGAGFYGIPGGSVKIVGDLADANFVWTGGTLTSTNRITSVLNWTGGALDGALTVASNGALNVGGGGAVSLNGTITNAGSITLTDSATVYLVGSLNNLAGGTVEQRNDQTWVNNGGSPLIQNAGTFRKLASSGTTTFAGGLAFVNTGLVDVQTGTLNFPAGFVSSGSFKVPAGAAVTLTGGTFEFKAGHSFTGAGFYGIPGGSVKIVGDLADANFVWTGGTLTSTNRITSVLNWTGGALDGALTVASNGALNVGGGGAVSLNGTITNAGSITLTDSATVYLVGSLNNLAGGTVEQRNDQTWVNNGGSPLIQNAGTFRKLASSGTTTFAGGLAFVNTGLVDVQTGALSFADGFTQTAGSTILNGGNLSASRPIQIQGGSLAGSGTITATVTNSSQVSPGASPGVLNIVGNYIQTASGVLNIELAGLTPDTFDQLTVSQTASLDGLLQTVLIKAFTPPTNSAFLFLSADTVNGTFARHNYPSNQVDFGIDYTAKSASIKVLNVFTNVTKFPPVITAVPDRTVDELAQLRLTVTATDADGPTTVFTFRLDDAPAGAAIDSNTGVFTWTPTEAQGQGKYPITVRVTDNGGLFDTKTFNVIVNEVNQPPVLAVIPAQLIGPGLTLGFTAAASDADLPAQTLTFALGSGVQPGMNIDSTSGRITWAVPASQPAGKYNVTVRVTDDGPGSLSAVQVVVIEVDRNGPRILAITPSGLVSNSVDHVDITFDKPINPGTFDSSDIDLRGAAGPVVASAQSLGESKFRISFAALSFGDYTLKVGPLVTDLAGNSMNQDGDGTNGEPGQDLFIGQIGVRLPDLLVRSIMAPAQGLIGQPVTLSWVITNQGNAAVSPPWHDVIILVNQTPPGGEQELAYFTFTNALPAGQSITNTRSLIIPAGISGQRLVKIYTDYSNQVDEGPNENNNTTEDDQPFQILAPDLVVTSVSAPANSQFGQSAAVVWTVKNLGTGQALAGWSDNLYLSTATNSLAGAVLLQTLPVAEVAPLAVGASYTRTQTVTWPLNSALAAGKYFIAIVANADGGQPESNHDNNIGSQSLLLSPPPLPDLLVNQIVAPASAVPAQPVELRWTITNQGNLAASGTWSETISISNYPPLVTYDYTNTLAAGASLVRTQFVTIPVNGPAGALRFQVEVDSGWNIVESNETNNLMVAGTSTTVPAMLSLLVPISELAENAGHAQATVTRNGDRAQPLVVALTSSDASELAVPATVTIPAGQVTALFEISVHTDGIVDGPQPVTITAAADGFSGAAAHITVLDVDKPRLTLSIDETNLLKSATVVATVQRDPISPDAVVVQLTSSDAARLSVPATVTIPANAGSAWFQIEAVNDYLITAPRRYTVSAAASGFVSDSTTIQVTEGHIPGLSISLGAPEVSEAAGALATTGTVSRDTVGPRPLIIALESDNPNVARVPSSVTIPAGASSASFPIGAINNDVVDGKRTVLIRAYLLDSLTGVRISASPPASLDVLDDDGPTLRLQVDREVVAEGLIPAATATVWRNSDSGSSLTVTLASSDTSEATVPATVMIPAGQILATFPVNSVNDGVTDGDQTVTLTVSAAGFTSGTARLTVTDRDLPDLTVANVSIPPTGVTDGSFEATFRVANNGLAAATGSIMQRVFLSSDAAIGDDALVGQAEFSGTVAPGSHFDQTLTLRLPRTPGNYWVIVTTDSAEKVAEILENNNAAISVQPIRVEKTYGATVQAEIEVAPAGTPVPLHGQATLTGGGQPVPFSPVNIHLEVRGTKRIISVQTDRDGRFATVFQPLPGEAGRYQVGADFPGVTQTAAQDSFVLLGLRVTPPAGTLRIIEGGELTGSARVENLGDLPLNDLSATIIEKPANLQVSLRLTNTLAGLAETSLQFTITPTDTSIPQGLVLVRLSNPDRVSADLYLPVAIDRLRPHLVVEPGSLVAGMKRGGQTTVQFRISNTGGAASGELNVMPPAIPWLMVASGATLASLAPGSNTTVTLILTPPADLALGDHQGNIVISGAAASVAVPFNFRSLSVAAGDLKVTAVDEYTYYAQGSPNVTNATVSVTDELSGQLVASGLTDARGEFMVTNLTEAYYRLDVRADGHGGHHSTFLLGAGKTNDVLAFLPRDTVKYIWTVVPTDIEDRTRINIETVFETVVPIPVVTVEPMLIDLAGFQGEETQVDLKISNHGLVAAENTRLDFEPHPEISVTPLVSQIGTLKANSSITVPLIIRRLHPNLQAASVAKSSGLVSASSSAPSCDVRGGAFWDLICGPTVRGNGVPIVLQNAGNNCGSGGQAGLFAGGGFGGFFTGAGGTGFEGGGSGGVSAVYWGPIEGNTQPPCNLCPLKMLVSATECALKFVSSAVMECLKNSYKCASGAPTPATAYSCSKAFYKCLEAGGATFTYLGYLKLFECAAGMLTACDSATASSAAVSQQSTHQTAFRVDGRAEAASTVSRPELEELRKQVDRLGKLVEVDMLMFGDQAWFQDETGEAQRWLGVFLAKVEETSDAGPTVSAAERAQLLALNLPAQVTATNVHKFVDRWNRSLDYYAAGIYRLADVPSGQSLDFIAYDLQQSKMAAAEQAIEEVEAEGYASVPEAVEDARRQLVSFYQKDSGGGDCATVRLRIEQQAVITRDAFDATLEIINSTGGSLENVSVELTVQSENGEVSTSLFGIRPPKLQGLSGVDGTGVINANSTGKASWIIIPTSEAAPLGPKVFYVSGKLAYVQEGVSISIPLAPASITVLPNASLKVKYFHQRDVFSDDPFTPEIEPSIPFSLGVLIQNNGNGAARNVRITSAQPKIIDNEKGLLIDFEIIGSEVNGQNASPSLSASFGNIAPGQVAVGRWLLRSSLQGLFTDYQASFEHLDGLGDKRLSLIDSVEIHEMNHVVRAGGPFEDGLPDFLVNDLPDLQDMPDALYLSDGRIQPVSLVSQATTDGSPVSSRLEVKLTATMPPGWAYLQVPDPVNGQFRLERVLRANGSEVRLEDNVWITDRTFIGNAQRPVREYILHLLDFDSPGTYTLVYGEPPAADLTPPVSTVAALPPNSFAQIPVRWSGEDGGSGLDSYDIFVSVNGGPFSPWLRKTTLTGALYAGKQNESYAFYSVATDLAGNREAPHNTPDTQTTVNLVNTAPQLAVPASVVLNEGATLVVTNTAVDLDVPANVLQFSLDPGAPLGAIIDPVTGVLTWVTGEATGPSTNRITVRVTDNGEPSLSATGLVQVVVLELNQAPILNPIPDQTINEGKKLMLTAMASDSDLPPNPLTFHLDASAPAGASITPSGILTWTPTALQGPSTNRIAIIVADNGIPSLTATQTFTVVVRDVLGDFVLGLGSTNVLAGQKAAVLVSLSSGAGLTNVTFTIEVPEMRLTNLVLQPLVSEIAFASIQPVGPDRSRIQLIAGSGQVLDGNRAVAQLGFEAVAAGDSALVTLGIELLEGNRASGSRLTNGTARAGRVIVIGPQPVLEAMRQPERSLVLYGRPGNSYGIEFKTNLAAAATWAYWTRVPLTNTFLSIGGLDSSQPFVCYRAFEFVAKPAMLEVRRSDQAAASLLLYGEPGIQYQLQSTADMADEHNWLPESTITLTNSFRFIERTNLTGPARFYRIRAQ